MNEQREPKQEDSESDPLFVVGRFITDPQNAGTVTAIATAMIFLSGVVYTVASIAQWRATSEAANAARISADASQSATSLMRQQLIASEGAVVQVRPEMENNAPKEGLNGVVLRIRNSSPSTASRFIGNVQIIKQSIPDERAVWTSAEFAVGPKDLESIPAGENRGFDRTLPFQLSAREVTSIEEMKMTISVKGAMKYWNGFEEATRPLCFDYFDFILKDKTGFVVGSSGPDFMTCDEYISGIHIWLQTKRDSRQKVWPGHKP